MHSGAPFPPHAAEGQQATGPPANHWFASGYSPAGDVWTTAHDLGRFLEAVIGGTAPGARAAVPVHDAGPGQRVGLGWLTTRIDGRDITWHNGATGGFTSYMGFDRATGRGVAVLSNTSMPVDVIGERLLGLRGNGPTSDTGQLAAAVLGSLGAAVPALTVVLRPALPAARRSVLLGVHGSFGGAALWATWRLGDWITLPSLVWTVGAAALAACVLTGVGRTRSRAAEEKDGQVSAFVKSMCRAITGWAAGLTVLLVNVM
jgi:CubicO group peptidase (beta-lactamase class C family)